MVLGEPWKRDDPMRWLRNIEASLSDHDTRRCLLRGLSYLLILLGLNLAWEIAQLPLYTMWATAPAGAAASAVAHCTFGDGLIAGSALFLAWVIAGRPRLQTGIPPSVATVAVCLGLGFTIFSEWHATQVSHSWEYSSWMPVIPVLQVGLTPVLQWIVLPPIAMQVAFGFGNGLSQRRF